MSRFARLMQSACGQLMNSCPGLMQGNSHLLNKIPTSNQPALRRTLSASTQVFSPLHASTDAQQERQLQEMCLLVDREDAVVGAASKRDCHTWDGKTCPLHRAFSVFLFDSGDRLLLQRRSNVKITFPGCLTNTCCSHPLAVEGEREGAAGVIRAAQRRLKIELGIQPHQVPTSAFQYITRMHYSAASGEDGVWGEHEMDYILVLRADVQLQPNASEVQSVDYVSRAELSGYLSRQQAAGVPLTPWFRLIADTWLTRWWENLDRLHHFTDHHTIHRL